MGEFARPGCSLAQHEDQREHSRQCCDGGQDQAEPDRVVQDRGDKSEVGERFDLHKGIR